MKKLISLLLVIIIICAAMAGCDWEKFFTSATTKIITTVPNNSTPTKITTTTTTSESTALFDPSTVIWEDKLYCEATINDDFQPGRVIVLLDKAISNSDAKYYVDFYSVLNVVDVQYLVPAARQPVIITLVENTKEAVLEAIKILETIDGIYTAHPAYNVYPEYIPNDEYFDVHDEPGQWSLEHIQVTDFWDFSIGAASIRVGIIDSGI